jgi:PAS domain S-box-containing protein
MINSAPTDAILESISDGVFTVDLDWRITSFNRAAEKITGVSRHEAIGSLCSEVFRSSMCEVGCALRETLKTDKPIIDKSCFIIDNDGNRRPISVSTAVLRDSAGVVIGAAETFRDLSEIEELRSELVGRHRIGNIVSRSPLMEKIFEIVSAVATSISTVLVLGETGTGKELLARTIHDQSDRSSGPFIAVNCGALPDTLLESELFGYEPGAFTGATKSKAGRFELARGGTLFLDEIGDISSALQVRLLRVLQERTFEPLGSTRQIKADVRIIAATNRRLSELMKTGKFREDLYYRINVMRIELPPLRSRKEDLPLLVNQFISSFNNQQAKSITQISSKAMALFMAYDWPGNIRELENVIERAFILCTEGEIGIEHLPQELALRPVVNAAGEGIAHTRELLETQAILSALERSGYNRLAAARALGIHKSTLFRKIRKLGIELPPKGSNRR